MNTKRLDRRRLDARILNASLLGTQSWMQGVSKTLDATTAATIPSAATAPAATEDIKDTQAERPQSNSGANASTCV